MLPLLGLSLLETVKLVAKFVFRKSNLVEAGLDWAIHYW
jgi:hypothetical protein